jgi:DNA-binding transcriptional ArsR family regulator
MPEGPDIARIATLIGEPARANMLLALMRGGALTLSELAAEAGVGLPTASVHAARLAEGGLTRVRASGRHRFVELASPAVASLIEQLIGLSAAAGAAPGSATEPPTRRRSGPRDPALRLARVCYDHLAGEMGVQMYDSLTARGFLAHGADGLTLSFSGRGHMLDFGLDADALAPGRPPLCRECLDWSHRRSHLAGRLGRAMLLACEHRGWLKRTSGTRALAVTARGRRAFDAAFPPVNPDESLDHPRHSP